MSRNKVEKLAKEMPKEDLVEILMALYDAKKEAKDYLEYFLNPNEEKASEKCLSIIQKEFTKTGVRPPKGRISKCKKALDDFEALRPSADLRINARLYLAEASSKFGLKNWRTWEKCVKTVLKKFRETLVLIADEGLTAQYRTRIDKIQQQAQRAGYWDLEAEDIEELLGA